MAALLIPTSARSQGLDASIGARADGATEASVRESGSGPSDAQSDDAHGANENAPDADSRAEPDDGGSAGPSGVLTLPPPTEPAEPAVAESPAAPPPPIRPADRPAVVIKTILGLVALLVLAYVGGHPRVQDLERRLNVSQMITAGLPFVLLGLVARRRSVGILTDSVLASLGPLLRFGLGWIGFIIGFRFDVRAIETAPRGLASFVAARTLITFAVVVAACALLLLGSSRSLDAALTNPVFLRDALILGTAGALTSLTAPRLLEARRGEPRSVELVGQVVRAEELAGILGMLFIAAYFRPSGHGVTWQLPGTAWLLLTLGLGAVMGLLVYAILLRQTTSRVETTVLILGSVAFAAGLASQLRLSPVVVCFVVGLLLANLPGHYRAHLELTLAHLERPIYLLFLVVVGALWRVWDARGWALMVAFVLARLAGKWLGVRLGAAASALEVGRDARGALVVAPMGALSIAVVVGAQLLYPGGSISRITTAVVGGAIVMEVVVQAAARRGAGRMLDAGKRDSRPSGDVDRGQ